jgi:NAD(P) transhydrogenase subunit alpha
LLDQGQVLICLLAPSVNTQLVQLLAGAGVTSFALDAMPRISRAQAMDVLSSQSTVSGYRAVLLAVGSLATMAPMMMTAAGTIRPAGALVIGAGVAGLQAIATAKRLGAVVTAIDVRPSAREEVESLGAKFIPMEVDHSAQDSGGYATDLGAEFYRAEQEIIAPFAKKADFIISTALIPNRPAPLLITEEMVDSMKPGSVLVDMAGSAGGNCELSRPGQVTEHNRVTIHAPLNLPSEIPIDASEMFSSNVAAFINELLNDDGELNIDLENEIIKGTLITYEGESL